LQINKKTNPKFFFKRIYAEKFTISLFIIIFLLLFLIISLWSLYRERDLKGFSVTLDSFKSDYIAQAGRRPLYEDIILKKRRFVSFGSYQEIPSGVYKAIFYLESGSPQPANLDLQIATDKGKSLLSSLAIRLDYFLAQREIQFKVNEKREIEPRVLYSSGNEDIKLEKVVIERIGGVFPWQKIFFQVLFYSIISTLILLSVLFTFKNSDRWKHFLILLFFFLGCSLILRNAWVSEDAFITLRHVDNLIHGLGPVFNVTERVEGYTHPLWFAVISLFRLLGLTPKGAVIVPGLIASFVALFLLFFKVRLSWGSNAALMLNPAAAILIGASVFIDFGTSGLETSLSYLLLILYAKFIAEDRWKSQPVATGLIVALLTLTRPDFIVFPIFLFCFYVYELLKKRIPFKKLGQFFVFPLVLVGGYQIFRMGYYASLFPNPFYTKSGSGAHISQGVKYLIDLFQGSLFSVVVFLVVLAFVLNSKKERLRSQLMILFSGLLHGFFVIRGGGDFMHGRFLLPAFILITVSITGAFDRFFEKKTTRRIAFIAIFLILFYLSLHILPVQKKGQFYNYGISDERYSYYKDKIVPVKYLFEDTVIMIWKNIGMNYRNLSREAKLNIRIAYKNVGFTGFYAGKHVYVVDQLGLADPVVSRIALTERTRPGHEKHAPFGYLILRKLTFHDTPFPLWNEVAATKFGVLWDLSPKTLKKLNFMLEEDFKRNIDTKIVDFINRIDKEKLKSEADLLFFLRRFWYPYASDKHQELFRQIYKKETINQHSTSFQWIKKNKAQVELILSHIEGPMNPKKFLGNLVFTLRREWTIKF